MTIYSLYVKTHKITGLKYLGQTKQNPFLYQGSGTDWKQHLKLHGYDVDTEVVLQTRSKEERNYWGRYYSNYLNVVTGCDDFGNKLWANRIPETGGGGSNKEAYDNPIVKKRMSVAQKISCARPEIKLKRSNSQQKRVESGTHNLLGPEENQQRIAAGTHNFVGANSPNNIRVSCLICKCETTYPTFNICHGDKCDRGRAHYAYDHTIYTFKHKDGTIAEMTQHELRLKYDLPKSNLNRMIKRDGPSVKGWSLAK